MIESNISLQTIQNMSRVQDETLDAIATSFTGYFTVNKEYNSNIFFWYIPAKVRFDRNFLAKFWTRLFRPSYKDQFK